MQKLLLIFILFFIANVEPITPLKPIKVNEEIAKLGKELFFDTSLSGDNTISCASCHDIENGGDDGLKFAFGIKGQEGDINSPTVLNAAYNFKQFWNGRAETLADQAVGPIENPMEMGNTFAKLIPAMNKTPYKQKFEKLYEDGITKQNIANAIAEYEKTLITIDSPFDRYLKGDDSAISAEQKNGYKLFKENGCISCHHGINVGGNLYNKFGVMQSVDSQRLGRYEVTGKKEDMYYFKVPSLRNIALTSPYLHDGRYESLEDTVKFMARYQLGRIISEKEIKDIVKFLNSLSGEVPQNAKR